MMKNKNTPSSLKELYRVRNRVANDTALVNRRFWQAGYPMDQSGDPQAHPRGAQLPQGSCLLEADLGSVGGDRRVMANRQKMLYWQVSGIIELLKTVWIFLSQFTEKLLHNPSVVL